MKVYTKGGDKGITSLFSGERVPKDSLRVEAYGTVDETDAALGLARSCCRYDDVRKTIYDVQKLLSLLMAELASTAGNDTQLINQQHVTSLEETIDHYAGQLEPLKHFIIAGDNQAGAALNLARTVARRAERLVIALSRNEQVHEALLISLNRLSDLCFILARTETERIEATS